MPEREGVKDGENVSESEGVEDKENVIENEVNGELTDIENDEN